MITSTIVSLFFVACGGVDNDDAPAVAAGKAEGLCDSHWVMHAEFDATKVRYRLDFGEHTLTITKGENGRRSAYAYSLKANSYGDQLLTLYKVGFLPHACLYRATLSDHGVLTIDRPTNVTLACQSALPVGAYAPATP